jgi:AcrR family transcriptional regulator
MEVERAGMCAALLSPLKQARRERLVDAAERLFQEAGFRGAAMEAIARAAGVSKATLYSYFPDKEAAFVAVAERLAARLLAAFEAGLEGDGDIARRAHGALVAKHRTVLTTVRRFPEAADLFATQARLSAAIFRAVDAAMVRRLGAALCAAGRPEPDRLAALLFAAAQGVANAASEGALDADLRLLVDRLVGG